MQKQLKQIRAHTVGGKLIISYRICGHSDIRPLYFIAPFILVKVCLAPVVQLSLSPVSCPADDEAALSMGIVLWAGILVVVFVLLLLAVDVTCYFVNKCGLIMCLCGKSGTGTKSHNLEEGKAAFM